MKSLNLDMELTITKLLQLISCVEDKLNLLIEYHAFVNSLTLFHAGRQNTSSVNRTFLPHMQCAVQCAIVN